MKPLIELFVVGSLLACVAGAQESARPALRKGVSVQMPVASHAEEMPAADEPNATIVAIGASGEVFAGIQRTEPSALSLLSAETVYVKADARAPFQTVLTVLDALRGKSVVLLAAPPATADKGKIVPPYGIKAILVAPAPQPDEDCELCGVWQGFTHGKPSVELLLERHTGGPNGRVTFVLLHLIDAEWRAVGRTEVPMIQPQWQGKSLTFRLRHDKEHGSPERGPDVEFRLEPQDRDKALLVHLDDASNTILTRKR